MNSRTIERPVQLSVRTLPFASLGGMSCPTCGGILEITQPDADRTDRFLAICSKCDDWSLISYQHDTGAIRLISLAVVTVELERGKPSGNPERG